jgi:hypothetical protein
MSFQAFRVSVWLPVIGFFHTHPNTREEGYRPAANRYDYQFLEEMGVPGMIKVMRVMSSYLSGRDADETLSHLESGAAVFIADGERLCSEGAPR